MQSKILIVDDEPAIGTLLTYQLRGCNYAVHYVSDGLTALEQIERERPDLVLLDVMMPTISGWDVCRQIRTYSNVPVIMLTAKSSDADIVTGLTAGADDYIAKPFSMSQLHARIEAVLRRTRNESRPRGMPIGGVSQAATLHTPRLAPTTLPASTEHMIEPQHKVVAVAPTAALGEQANRLGPRLREARLARGIPLIQAARECATRWEFLQAIEQENYLYVPRQQLRGGLQRYSTYLNIDTRQWMPPAPQVANNHQVVRLAILVTLLLLVAAVSVYLL